MRALLAALLLLALLSGATAGSSRQAPAGSPDRPPAGALPDRPPAGAQPDRPPVGAQPDRPPAGALPDRPPDAAQPDRPPQPPAPAPQQKPDTPPPSAKPDVPPPTAKPDVPPPTAKPDVPPPTAKPDVPPPSAKPDVPPPTAKPDVPPPAAKPDVPPPTPAPRCPPIELSAPIVLSSTGSSHAVGDSVTVSCQKGYSLSRSSRSSALPADSDAQSQTLRQSMVLTCMAGSATTATWSTPPRTLHCIPLGCPDLKLTDSKLQATGLNGTHGTVRRFSCEPPYTLEGSNEARCDAGKWAPEQLPRCVLNQCDSWVTPVNGSAVLTSNSSEVRALRYSCQPGFMLHGKAEAYCTPAKKWSSPAPECRPFGLKPYHGRTASSSLGSLSADNKFVLKGLLKAARDTPACIGFTLSKRDGAVRVTLLKAHESFLQRAKGAKTFLFGKNGTHELHKGFAASENATLAQMKFAEEAHVLDGVRRALRRLRAENPALLGFSVATGVNFHVQLFGWSGLPLVKDSESHAFTLQAAEELVREVGCNKGSKVGDAAPLGRKVPPPHGKKQSSRLLCAAEARKAGHRYFALSDGTCYTGNQDPARYGAAPKPAAGANATATCGGSFAAPHHSRKPGAPVGLFHTYELDSTLLESGLYASRCRPFSAARFDAPPDQLLTQVAVQSEVECQRRCSDNIRCTRALFTRVVGKKASRSCALYRGAFSRALSVASSTHTSFDCRLPRLLNGGFEHSRADKGYALKDGSLAVSAALDAPKGWRVHGSVGVASEQSLFTNLDKTVPEGKVVLYLEKGASISQRLRGLTVGQRYHVSFRESLRTEKPYTPGLGLVVRVDEEVLYANHQLHVPLWSKRGFVFTATQEDVTLRFETVGSSVLGKGKQHKSALLLDAVEVREDIPRAHFARTSATGKGLVATIQLEHPKVLAAISEFVKTLPNIVGFSVKGGEVRLLSRTHLHGAGLLADAPSTIRLNNGTVLSGKRTLLSAGKLHFASNEAVHAALRRIAAARSNSIGYSLSTGTVFSCKVWGFSALPTQTDAREDLHLFGFHPTNLGCVDVPKSRTLSPAHPFVLPEKHQLKGGVSKYACMLAAARAGHRYFALQNRMCLSGNDSSFRALPPSHACTLRCVAGGRDLCGGDRSAVVYALPSYSARSKHGHVSVYPRMDAEEARRARMLFDKPGAQDFSSLNAPEPTVEEMKQIVSLPPFADGSRALFRHSLVYHFPRGQREPISLYTMTAALNVKALHLSPRSWVLSGSNNGGNWTVLDRVEGAHFSRPAQTRTFRLWNTQEFNLYRFDFLDSSAGGLAAPGVALSGLALHAPSNAQATLAALYRFEDRKNLGFDSSAHANDLGVFGQEEAVSLETDPNFAHMGRGYLRITPSHKGQATYLAVDAKRAGLLGQPEGFSSFSVAFWFHTALPVPGAEKLRRAQGVLEWGRLSSGAGHAVVLQNERVVSSLGSTKQTSLRTPKSDEGLAGRWVHYAAVWDARLGVHTAYIDGVAVASTLSSPRLHLSGDRFSLAFASGAQFSGLLDDVALFRGALTRAQVRRISYGDFSAWTPLGCQEISDRYAVAAGESWGDADEQVKKSFVRQRCSTTPTDCQSLSDVTGLSPISAGEASLAQRELYAELRCATWPSFLIRPNTAATCPGKHTLRYGVLSKEDARRQCLSAVNPTCGGYVWSAHARRHVTEDGQRVTLPAYTLLLCSTPLGEGKAEPRAESATRLRDYLVRPESSGRCDEEQGFVVANVRSGQEARALCDAQRAPPCKGYIWTGPRGVGRNSSAEPTPYMAMLCAGFSEHQPLALPDSGYESGAVLGDYMLAARRVGECAPVSIIGVQYDVLSSLHARLHCDRYDGVRGPKCVSYTWDRRRGEVTLCGGAPNLLAVAEHFETGWLRPTSCEQLSNRWFVSHNESWGIATPELRRMYVEMECSSKPSACQTLSDFYNLSPTISSEAASRVPGSIRELWLRQRCATTPNPLAADRHKPTYRAMEARVAAVQQLVDTVDALLLQAKRSSSPDAKEQIVRQVDAARLELADTLQRIKEEPLDEEQ